MGTMPWTLDAAKGLARTLKAIPGFAWDDENISATAMALMRWCKDTYVGGFPHTAHEKAVQVTQEALDNWTKWQGTAALYALYKARYTVSLDPARVVWNPGASTPAPVACVKCNDFGTARREDGWSEWCDCETGVRMQRESPDWLAVVNKHLAPKPRLVREEEKPLTPAQIAALSAQERLIVEQTVTGAEATIHSPFATKEDKKVARKVLKLYRPKAEAS